MPYAKINPTGCGIHKNRAKLRLDFFLNADDPNYDKLHVVDETSEEYQQGYKGKLDSEGTDPEQYQEWLDSLPHIWRDNPFHSHFIYPDKDITDANLKAKIESCLNYFYAFHQHCWDTRQQFCGKDKDGNVVGLWERVPRVKGSIRDVFVKGAPKDLSANHGKIQNILSKIQEFQVGVSKVPPQDLNIGEKGTIDIGPGATDRSGVAPEDYTYVDFANPANETGTIDTFEVWANEILGTSTKVGTFYGSGTTYSNRDGETIGIVEAGAKRTFTGLDIDVTSGDFAGIFFTSGSVERDWTGGAGYGFDPDDQFGTGEQTYSILAGDAISIYGTGEEEPPAVSAPTVTKGVGASNVGVTTARLNGEVTNTGGENPIVHIYWGTSDGENTPGDWDHDENLGVLGAGTFYKDISGLTHGTKYYYRCYAENSGGSSWSNAGEFTTLLEKPVGASNAATGVGVTVATLNGTVTDDGGGSCQYRFRYKKAGGAYVYTEWTGAKTTGETFSEGITGLDASSTYYFNAQVKNSEFESDWGAELTFTTGAVVVAPAGTTNDPTLVADIKATLNGKVTGDGGEACEVRFQYGLTAAYGTNTAWQPGKLTGVTFSQRITGLTPNTTYHFRAQIKNSDSTADGADKTFTTEYFPTPFIVRVLRDTEIKKTYRELKAQQDENWIESMFITKTEFGANFGTGYQVLDKIYAPVTKSGAKTIALVSSKGFTGKTNTLLEITIDGAGDPPAATFKWRKKTFLGDTWGDYTEGVATGADITVTDGIHINFNDTGYAVGNQWHVQACGTWHTPESGAHSYLTSIFVYPFDATPVAKAGYFRAWRGDYRIVDYATKQGEFPNWRTPIHLLGDGALRFKVELAEIGAGEIDSIFVVMEGWDEA